MSICSSSIRAGSVRSEVFKGVSGVVLADLQQKVYLCNVTAHVAVHAMVWQDFRLLSYLDLDLSVSPTQAGRCITPGST